MTTLELKNIRKQFTNGGASEDILKGISLSLQKGEVTALMGTSGSGKSTLLTIAAGLQLPSSGDILFEENRMSALSAEARRKIRATQFGFVFQSAHLVPFLTVEEQLLLMLDTAESTLGKSERIQKAERLLQLVGMEHRRHSYPASLSGGEKQRAAIARAVIHEPKVLFADEPIASLDSSRSRDVMKLLRDLTHKLQIATLLVTHDEEMLAYTDRVIHMSDGTMARANSLIQ